MIQHSSDGGLYVRRRPAHSPRATLLWIHGLGESGLGFEDLFANPRLAAWSMVAPDLAGYGKSPWPDSPLRLREQAAALADWLGARVGDPVVVVGHSMGGVVGTILCELAPDSVRGFINVEGNISIEDCTFSSRAAALELEVFLSKGFGDLLDSVFAAGFDSPALRAYYPSLRICDPRAYHLNSTELVELSQAEDMARRMAALSVPSCYLHGAPGGAGMHSQGLLRAAGIELAAVDGAGHWPFLDQAEAFVTKLSYFLAHEI